MRAGSPTPTFQQLKSTAQKTFLYEANFLPERLVYWSSRGSEGPCDEMTAVRSGYVAHRKLQMALPLNPLSDDLQFLLPYTDDMLSTIILIEKDEWYVDSRFEIICFEPDVVKNRLVYKRWTGLEFTISWAKHVSCKAATTFNKWETNLEQSHLDNAAHLFVDFLLAEFPV